ncbi:MAG: tRNA pseudouridine(13) synthase TruD [Xanthomonadales bacterium]|nr:tRNA pseudouridine(13) synthase TruD [Xanthomonadales bacterium]
MPEWPYFLGAPKASGIIRSCPEDFVVEEIPRVAPEGEGSHLWLWVEKRSANTDWVARELAKAAACPLRDVGYAGLKDRHAVTRQWFSVPDSDVASENLTKMEVEDVAVLEIHKHTRKLKRGTLDGNRFHLKIREFEGDIAQTEHRLQQIKTDGVPNYFGPQRFGRSGANVAKGYSLLKKRIRLQRNKESIYLSAIRSFMFNHVLAERVGHGNWNMMIDGDLAMLDGTRSIFPCELPDQDIEDRCQRLDIHPTGPMPGENGTQVSGAAAELEQIVLASWPELIEVLVSDRVQASRRSLRLNVVGLEWGFANDELELSFVLPPGAYATTVLREILIATEAERV